LVTAGIPLIGGMSMGLAFILACLAGLFIYAYPLADIRGIVLAALIMLIFGILDDLYEFSILAKFSVQIMAASILILFGIRTQIVNIGNLLNIIITLTWIIGITNAFNHLDVMDGLSASTALIVDFAFFAISILNGDIKTLVLSLALAGAIFSFLIFNLPPAKIYMGNSGSHFLGFVLAATALIISYAGLERKIALASPLLILGFPIFDTAFLILIRLSKKKLPFQKSNDHLVFRLLASGYSKRSALTAIIILCLSFSLCGVMLIRASNPIAAILITLVVLACSIITYRFKKVPING
jgi:UDP-GlcNAc:undecaprenyl-phosphate GlcNAc-1-phosphate transferase